MTDNARPEDATGAPAAPRRSPLEILLVFSQITLSGFGGTAFWTRLYLIEKRGWITNAEYVEAMSLAQLLPGPNVFNLAVIIGHRFGGVPGAAAALWGLVFWPFLMMLGIGLLYARYGELHLVQQALKGVSAVAVGLVIANATKLSSVLPARLRPWLFVLVCFAGIGVLRWPLIAVVAGLAALGVWFAWREEAAR
ncbi:MAG: chromate transporter [Burkholderiales bacterium]|nr:chromate transporter [Burkholderiales bacterium]